MSAWQDLVTASLFGTERAGVPRTEIPGLPLLESASQDPAAVLLDQAALLTTARRAGRRPGHAEPLQAVAPDLRPAVSHAAACRLARMLGGEHRDLLTEWLAAAAARGLRVPARLLPALLDLAQTQARLARSRHLVAEIGGTRARWLAGLNPHWKFLLVKTRDGDGAWRVGTTAERREYLAALHARDAGSATDLITGSWDMAGTGERAMFLAALADKLSPADEPLLEMALDDSAEEVRVRAAWLLAGLPGSALGQRMAARALGCVRLREGRHGTRLVVTPPARCDAAMRRDGITPGPTRWYSGPAGQSHLVLEVLARTPLRTWTGEFGRSAGQVLGLPSGGWTPVLFAGWARAAVNQRDQEWMAVLVSRALADGPSGATVAAETLHQLARRVDPALVRPAATAGRGAEPHPAVLGAIGVLRFRYDMLKELDDDDSAG